MSLAARVKARQAAGHAFDHEAVRAARAAEAAAQGEGPAVPEPAPGSGVAGGVDQVIMAVRPGRGSPAQRHRARLEAAARAAAPANDNNPSGAVDASPFSAILAQLGDHRRTLSATQSLERKIELKREMLPAYAEFVDAIVAAGAPAGAPAESEILSTVMIWRLDTGDFAGGLGLAQFVLDHGVPLPERFRRQPPVLVAEMVADHALAELKAGRHVPIDVLGRVRDMTAAADMPDEVRSKLYKAIGLELAACADEAQENAEEGGVAAIQRSRREAALEALQRAQALNARAGVVKSIDALERQLKKPDAVESADA